MNYERLDNELAGQLTPAYLRWQGAKARASLALRELIQATVDLGKVFAEVKQSIRLPFGRWCKSNCPRVNPKVVQMVAGVAGRTHKVDEAETWQLRLLGVVKTIHHSVRPLGDKRKTPKTSWLGYAGKFKEEAGKILAQGANADPLAKAAMRRQIDSLEELKKKLL